MTVVWNGILCETTVMEYTAHRNPKRIHVTAKDVTEKEVSSSIGITDRSLSDKVQTNKSLLSRISTSENLSTSEHLNQKQQGKSFEELRYKYKRVQTNNSLELLHKQICKISIVSHKKTS
ncbi:hypothetical protein PSTG_02357 [Puccinia striiformis f. sp. tritici PST-78]|uniref:Uncharacterized protein n=1 Tax=Puccinia striiformis f. sp. tritici PST-78 TaxID=1165861 RepID=A0A0L0VYZ7_9BASI|nr:hypothetical protein PSTG_02357 [Puccinia striiformis f. sp. tritici PST-78]